MEINRRNLDSTEKEEDKKLWIMYCLLYTKGYIDPNKTYSEWKKEITHPTKKSKPVKDEDLNADGIKAIMDNLFPGG